MSVDKTQGAAYGRYFQALGMLAKNDIFGQLEHTIAVGFYESLRAAMAAYHDWDGDIATFEAAAESCIISSLSEGRLSDDLRGTLRLCADLANRQAADPQVTLNEVAKMKVYCDVYFVKKAREHIARQQRNAEPRPNAAADNAS